MAKVNRIPVPLIGWCVCKTMLCFSDPSCGATAQQVETGGKRECREEKKRKGRKIRPVVPLIESFGLCLLRSEALLQESGFMLS